MLKKTVLLKVFLSIILLGGMGLSLYGHANTLVAATPVIKSLDLAAKDYLDQSMKRALSAYALARGFNALISFLQELRFNLVITIPLGQILDPVNDLVERFSTIMLLSIVSLGIQKLLIEIGTWLGLIIIFPLSLLVLLAAVWLRGDHQRKYLTIGYNVVILALFIRFCIPILGASTGQIYRLFLQEKAEKATQVLEASKEDMESLPIITNGIQEEEGMQAEPPGVWDKVKSLYNQSTSGETDIRGKIDEIKRIVSEAIEYFLNLIIIFILETIVVPLFCLGALVYLGRYVLKKSVLAARSQNSESGSQKDLQKK